MAFLFQDQNQGTRNDEPRTPKHTGQGHGSPQPFSFIRTLTVGLGFAPNLLTLPLLEGRRSRAWAHRPYRRWGLPPRPENIGRLGMSRPAGKYDERSGLQQAARPGIFSWSPCPKREPSLPSPSPHPSRGEVELASNQKLPPPKVNNFLPALFRFRFVLLLTNALWTADSHVVESPPVRLRRFRKSHHLIPAGPSAARECSL